MKKKFLKVALFSLIMAAPATSFVSCTDYDDDITNLTDNDSKLQEEFNNKLEQQNKALEAKIAELKTAQTALETEAKQAGVAAETAAKAAAEAQKAAEEAQKTGNQAVADAQNAQAEAMKANATAEAALKAVDEAKAAMLAETISQIEALQASIEKQIDELKAEYGKNYEALTAAINDCAKKGDIAALQQQIDAIKTLSPEEVNTLIKDYLTKVGINETTINGINGRLEGIDSQIAGIDTKVAGNTAEIANIVDSVIPGLKAELEDSIAALEEDVNDFIEQYNSDKARVDAQILALQNFQNTYESLLQGLSGEMDNINGEIDNIKDELETINGLIAELTGSDEVTGIITQLRTDVDNHAEKLEEIDSSINGIQQDIQKINGNLNLLAQKSSKRLTSITLVPTAYRDGIPNIDFFTAEFTPLGKLDKETGLYEAPAADAKKVSVNSEKAKVLYRLNPAGVTVEDIEAPSFVQAIATSRAANEAVLEVVSFNKSEEDASILEVYATKNVANKIDNAGAANNFYTVALKVPIAEKNRYTWTEGEGENKVEVTESAEDAVVYSEYARISDTWFTPAITATASVETPEWKESNLYTWAAVQNAEVLAEVNYNAPTDLTQFVTGCMNYSGKHSVMTAEDMEMFGFSIECNLFSQEYLVNGVDQQTYASVENGVLTPVTPKGGNILDRLAKTPVIEVVMKDSNNNVIAQKFFKVEYALTGANTNFTITYDAFELACTAQTEVVTWKQINDVIISKLGFDMTKEQFIANYVANAPAGVTVDLDATGKDDDQPIIWTINVADMILNGSNKVLSKEIKFTNAAGLYPELKLTLNVTVNWPSKLPELGKSIPAFWTNNTLRVLPVAMPTPYTAGVTATYNTNILQGRQTPYLTNLLDCSIWDIIFKTAPAGYEVNKDNSYEIVLPGKAETDPAELAATLWYGESGKTALDLTKADADDKSLEAYFFIENEAAGIAMVENEMTIGLGWNIELTGIEGNPYSLNNTSIKIIKPLQSLATASIAPITQNSTTQIRELATNMTITDAFGNEFKAGSDYWKYYDITKVDWTSGEMTITDKAGTVYTLDEFNLKFNISEAGVLTYSGDGIAIYENVTLNVPVTVTHKWGKLQSEVHVTILPGIK